MTETSMVERVARAIYEEQEETPIAFGFMPVWDRLEQLQIDGLKATARAAISAMREPTDLMGNGLPHGYRPGTHSATEIWRAMIDVALKSGEER